MATFVKYVMEIYFEKLFQENEYDKFILQQVWDETNSLMQVVLANFEKKHYPQIQEKKDKLKETKVLCTYEYSKGKKKGSVCNKEVLGPNRSTCYRHTLEKHKKVVVVDVEKKEEALVATVPVTPEVTKKKVVDEDGDKKKCIFVPNKGKYANTKCGKDVTGEADFCKGHLEVSA